MQSEERSELRDFAWGSYLGFIFFFARRLYIPGILHIVWLAISAVVLFSVHNSNPSLFKWILLPCGVVEIAFLTIYGYIGNRLSWKSCNWKSPHKFVASNQGWALLGRFAIVLRIINLIAYIFLQPPAGIRTLPNWVEICATVFYALLVIFLFWRVRGPIWAVALNTLKESFAKLEVVTLFLIGMVFVILFNAIWLVPTVREAVLIHFEQNPNAAQVAGGRSSEEVGQESGDVISDEAAFTDKTYQNALYRLRVQAAAFLFGEFFIALICFALGIFLISNEISRGVVLTVLPKPIGRGEYVVGKILGGWIIAVACFEIMALISLAFAAPYSGTTLDNVPNIFHAMLLMPIKFAILLTLIVYFSMWLPEAAAGFIGLVLFLGGHTSEYLLDLATDDFANQPWLSQSLKATHVILPNLSAVTSTEILDPNATDFTTYAAGVEWVFWALLYLAVVMALAVFTFRKRSL